MKRFNRKYQFIVIVTALFAMVSISIVSYAWFVVINRTDSFIATAAKVEASYQITLDGTPLSPEFYVLAGTTSAVKSGVYRINVSDVDAFNYLTNLRINIIVESTTDTYLRVAIIDSLTLATIDFAGNRGEVAIVDQPINYPISRHWYVNDVYYENLVDAEIALGGISASDEVIVVDDWYNNSLRDGYYYYPQLIERDMGSLPLLLPFIEAYDGDEFSTKPFGYSLQFAILVEAVQAGNQAPEVNWQLSNPPWGGVWA